MVMAGLWFNGSLFAQESRWRQESPRPRDNENVRSLSPAFEEIIAGEPAR
jgi:hypothetical protein